MKASNILLNFFFAFSMLIYSGIYAQNKDIETKTNAVNFYKPIEFFSQNVILRGRLYLPEDKSWKSPVVIMAHGFTTTINGMTADKYAEKFREAGFAVLLYDHRNLGSSDGEPRQEINPWVQTRGYIDCIDFALSQPEIDTSRIAVWGCSLSATEVFLVGSIDDRVKAIVTLVPGFGKDLPKEKQNDKIYAFAKDVVLSEHIMKMSHKSWEQMPVVTAEQLVVPPLLKN